MTAISPAITVQVRGHDKVLEPYRVLWPLEHLTVWSNEQRAWTDLLFNIGGDPEAETAPDEMDALQDAEDYYLFRVGHTGGSPYLFRILTAEDG